MFKVKTSKKGSALILVIIMVFILAILGTTVLGLAVSENRMSVRQENKTHAYNIARSGAQSVAEYMIRDANGDAYTLVNQTSDSNGQIGGGEFSVEVDIDPDSGLTYISSTALYQGVEQKAVLQLSHTTAGQNALFEHAIVGKDKVALASGNGNGATVVGSIASNGIISLGDKMTTGDQLPNQNLYFPPIVEPPNRIPAIPYYQRFDSTDSNSEDLNLDKKSKTIDSGSAGKPKYLWADKVFIKNATLSITGSGVVHLYVDGDVIMDTQAKVQVNSSAKFYIYVMGNRNISWEGSGKSHNLFIYAPESKIYFDNADKDFYVFGGLIGREVLLNNHLTIEHNPDMVNAIDLDTSGEGVNYVGYTWVEKKPFD